MDLDKRDIANLISQNMSQHQAMIVDMETTGLIKIIITRIINSYWVQKKMLQVLIMGQIQCAKPGPMEKAIMIPSKEKSDPICSDDNNKGSDFLCRSKPLGKLSQSAVGNNEEHSNHPSLQLLQEIVKLPTTGILDTAST
ncbi:hypothetical protein V6Z11_A13G224500 [Gossypium hirsutum]